MGDGQLPILDTEQMGELLPALHRALSTKDTVHSRLVWTIRHSAENTVLVLRWEKKEIVKKMADNKRMRKADTPASRPRHVPEKKPKADSGKPPVESRRKKSLAAQRSLLVIDGKCERKLPVHTTVGAGTITAATATPKKRRKTPCRYRHDLNAGRYGGQK
jgi:hypothetical protein